MINKKILWFSTPYPDYMTYTLIKGFARIFLPDNIYTFDFCPAFMGKSYKYPSLDGENSISDLPYWKTYHVNYMLEYPNLILKDSKPYDLFNPLLKNLPYRTEDHIINMINNGDFSLFIINAMGNFGVKAAMHILSKVKRNKITPLIIYDGHDLADKRDYDNRWGWSNGWDTRIKPYLDLFKPDLYFLREYAPDGPASQDDRVRPLQYLMSWYDNPNIKFIHEDQEKELDVYFQMDPSSELRIKCWHVLEKYLNDKGVKWDGSIFKRNYTYIENMRNIAKARISIDIPGAGNTCLRHWEIPSPTNTLMLRPNPKDHILIREDWTDEENVINYERSPKNLVDKLDYALTLNTEEIGRKGHQHLMEKHKDIHGVNYILDCLKEKGFNI